MCVVADYSFMHFGGLYDALIRATREATLRFEDEAEQVLGLCISLAPHHGLDFVRFEVTSETGIDLTDDDLEFLRRVAMAHECIQNAAELLKGGE